MESRPKWVTTGTLCVFFLMAFRALGRRWFALSGFHGVAIDAETTLGGWVVESSL